MRARIRFIEANFRANSGPSIANFLPILRGKAFGYRRTADGEFILYSIGWNEKDDGGNLELSDGDWVWPSEAK